MMTWELEWNKKKLSISFDALNLHFTEFCNRMNRLKKQNAAPFLRWLHLSNRYQFWLSNRQNIWIRPTIQRGMEWERDREERIWCEIKQRNVTSMMWMRFCLADLVHCLAGISLCRPHRHRRRQIVGIISIKHAYLKWYSVFLILFNASSLKNVL